MEAFQLSRKKMADLLIAIKNANTETILYIMEQSISDFLNKQMIKRDETKEFISLHLPSIFEKLIKGNKKQIGFSINEIVLLGNVIEYTSLSSSAVQNWVKREMKGLVGPPQFGKKYTVEQAAILFIVEDLKTSLDFDTIRRILALVFNDPADRTDDIVDPIDFYVAYATVYEKTLQSHSSFRKSSLSLNEMIANIITHESNEALAIFPSLTEEQRDIVKRVLIISTLTIQSTYYQAITRKHVSNAFSYNETE